VSDPQASRKVWFRSRTWGSLTPRLRCLSCHVLLVCHATVAQHRVHARDSRAGIDRIPDRAYPMTDRPRTRRQVLGAALHLEGRKPRDFARDSAEHLVACLPPIALTLNVRISCRSTAGHHVVQRGAVLGERQGRGAARRPRMRRTRLRALTSPARSSGMCTYVTAGH